jgi:hypothetical protein
MMPAELVTAAVAVRPDPAAQLPHLLDEVVAAHAPQIFVHLMSALESITCAGPRPMRRTMAAGRGLRQSDGGSLSRVAR